MTEVLPKEKKQKEEKTLILGQAVVDLLPLLEGQMCDILKAEITKLIKFSSREVQKSASVNFRDLMKRWASFLCLTLSSLDWFGLLFAGESSFETMVPLHPVPGSPLEPLRSGVKVIRVLTLDIPSCTHSSLSAVKVQFSWVQLIRHLLFTGQVLGNRDQ